MRYLLILVLLFSANLFGQEPPAPVCQNPAGGANDCGFAGGWPERVTQGINICVNNNPPGIIVSGGQCHPDSPNPNGQVFTCYATCSCASGFKLNTIIDSLGRKITSCVSDDPTPNGPQDCAADTMVYDPVSGTFVCPASGDGSSSASSNSCVVPGDYDGDCFPDNASSAASSAAASTPSPSSASNSSSGNDGGGDSGSGSSSGSGSGGDGGSGSGPGTGGGTGPGTGPGTGSAANSSTNNSSGTNSSSGSNASSGVNNSWNPYSGYGNWIPIDGDSPCPNKYVDVSGQWWCAGPSNTGGGGGTGSSAAGGSGSSKSAAGECDPTAKNYLSCISQGDGSSSISSGSASSASSKSSTNSSGSSAGTFSSLGEKGEFDTEVSEKRHEELIDELNEKIADIKAQISSEIGGTISGQGDLQDFCKTVRSTEVCFGLEKWKPFLGPISGAIFLVACVVSFAIVLRP